jgi:hypothetical protein
VALDRASETLSVRYAMDFRKAAERYCALGTPQMVAERIRAFHAAGVRHVVLDLLGPYEHKSEQIAWFARDVLPLLVDLTTGRSENDSPGEDVIALKKGPPPQSDKERMHQRGIQP